MTSEPSNGNARGEGDDEKAAGASGDAIALLVGLDGCDAAGKTADDAASDARDAAEPKV